MLKPEYGGIIIVLVKYLNNFFWYVSEKECWVLDYSKWQTVFESELEFEDPLRDGIPVLDEKSWPTFSERVSDFLVSRRELTQLISSNLPLESWEKSAELFPSLFIDFDEKRLLSLYPEYLAFEEYTPNGWKGGYEDFLNVIPPEEKYWIVNGVDHFPKQ